MTIYLIRRTFSTPAIAFTDKQLAEEYLSKHEFMSAAAIQKIELITDQFMEQILQPKESHETNTNSSL